MTEIAAGAEKVLQAHVWQREENEHYVEPHWCSIRLFEEEKFTAPIWEPCCGFGNIPFAAMDAGYCARGTDIVSRGYRNQKKVSDFLAEDLRGYDIVCNPPFNIAAAFAAHALTLAERKVAMIFPTARLNAAHWLRASPLRRIWFLTPRPSMPPGHVIARGEKPGGGKMDFCWLVWERGYTGVPETRWLHRDGNKAQEN